MKCKWCEASDLNIKKEYDLLDDTIYYICRHCGKILSYENEFNIETNFLKKRRAMKILIKFPTRERSKKFMTIMDKLIEYTEDKNNVDYLLTLDKNDPDMNNEIIYDYINLLSTKLNKINITTIYGESNNKIHAVNRDLNEYNKPWDIVILMSDDMIPVKERFDVIIRQTMERCFPDTDGILYFPDGYTPMNTLPIIGRKYYERFNYIYYPGYKSFFCDNQFHIVADLLNKQYKHHEVLFRHDHPIWINNGWDSLYEKNQSSWKEDEELLHKMSKNNFDLEL